MDYAGDIQMLDAFDDGCLGTVNNAGEWNRLPIHRSSANPSKNTVSGYFGRLAVLAKRSSRTNGDGATVVIPEFKKIL